MLGGGKVRREEVVLRTYLPFNLGGLKASPERGGAREAGGGVRPLRRKVAAALSAAVTTIK